MSVALPGLLMLLILPLPLPSSAPPSSSPSCLQVNRVAMAGRPHRFLAANGSLEWGDIPASPPRPAIRANFFYQDRWAHAAAALGASA